MRVQPEYPEILKARLQERPLVLFGAGRLGLDIEAYCDSQNIPVACFVDSNAAKKKLTKPVILPKKLKADYSDANIVISSNVFFDEIKEELILQGISEERILSYKIFLPEEVTWMDLDSTAEWGRMRIRVRKMAEWLDSGISSVVDYGAGEMYLKTLLPEGVQYYPVDYIKRSDETILCDLNDGIFPQINVDAAVLSGVLEFLTTTEELLRHVCLTTKRQIVLTYMTLDKFPNIEARRASAYVNDYTENQLIAILDRYGFVLKATLIDPGHEVDTLFLFEKENR